MTTATVPGTPATKSAETKSSDRAFNFSAGPATLPEEVIHQAQRDLWNIDNSGIGIMEHSHRGKVFDRVIDEAIADCRTLGNVPDTHDVLFLQGGATMQFAMIPMNFLGPFGGGGSRTADYPDTGVWTSKAIKEAQHFGTVNVAFDGSKCEYDHVPSDDEMKRTEHASYLHYCSNNTIYGTRYKEPPKTDAPLIADTSSEMFSRPIDVKAHALIYAGAQKNLGPAGVTLVIIEREFMNNAAISPKGSSPAMLDYRQHAENESRLNTPPTFGIYFMGQVFKWLLAQGGLEGIEKHNDEKAKLIYDAIDAIDFYSCPARSDSRSVMNVNFRTPSEELDAKFLSEAAKLRMSGLKGHRNVGGLRASIYNAMPREGCKVLADFMRDFAAKNG